MLSLRVKMIQANRYDHEEFSRKIWVTAVILMVTMNLPTTSFWAAVECSGPATCELFLDSLHN
jgi:hypothetical protein